MLKELKRELGLLMVLVMLAGCFEPLGVSAQPGEENTSSDVYYDNTDDEAVTEESGMTEKIDAVPSTGGIDYTGSYGRVVPVMDDEDDQKLDHFELTVSGCNIGFEGVKFTANIPEEEGDGWVYSWGASGIDADFDAFTSGKKYKQNGYVYYRRQSISEYLGQFGINAEFTDNILTLSSTYGPYARDNNSRIRLWFDCSNETKKERYVVYTDVQLKIEKKDSEIIRVNKINVPQDFELSDPGNIINSKDNPYVINVNQGENFYKWFTGDSSELPHWLLYYKFSEEENYVGAARDGKCFRYLDNMETLRYSDYTISGIVDFPEDADFILRAVSPDDANIYKYLEPDYSPLRDAPEGAEYEEIYFKIKVSPLTLSGIGIYDYSTSYVSEVGYQRYPDADRYENGTDICKSTSKENPIVLKYTVGTEIDNSIHLEALLNYIKENISDPDIRRYMYKADVLWELSEIDEDSGAVVKQYTNDNGENWGDDYKLANGLTIAFGDEITKNAGKYDNGYYKGTEVYFVGTPTEIGERLYKLTVHKRKGKNGVGESKTAWIKIVVEDELIKYEPVSPYGAQVEKVYTAEPDEENYYDIPMRYYTLSLHKGEAFGGVRFETIIGGEGYNYTWVVTRDDQDSATAILDGYRDDLDDLFTEAGFNGIKAESDGDSITFSSNAVGGYPNNFKFRLWAICTDQNAEPVVVRRDVLIQIEKDAADIYRVEEISAKNGKLLKSGKNSPDNPYILSYEQGDYISSIGILASYGDSFSTKLYTGTENNKVYPGENEKIYPSWAVYSYYTTESGFGTYKGIGKYQAYEYGDYYDEYGYWYVWQPQLKTLNNKMGSMPTYEFKGRDLGYTMDFMLRAYSPDCKEMVNPVNLQSNADDPNGLYKNVFIRVEVKKATLSDITLSGVENKDKKDGSTPEKAIEIRLKEGEELKAGKIKLAAALINSRGKDIASPYAGQTSYWDDNEDIHYVNITKYEYVPYWLVEEYSAEDEGKPKEKNKDIQNRKFSSEDYYYFYHEMYKGVRLVFGDTATYEGKYYITGDSKERYISFTGKPEGKGEKTYRVTVKGEGGQKKILYIKLVIGDEGEPEELKEPDKEPSVWPETEAGWYADYDTEISGSDMIIKKLKKDAKPGEYLVIPAKAEKDGKSYNVVLKGDMIWGAQADKIKGIKIEKGVKALNTESASGLFEQMEALEMLDITGLDTSAMTSMRDMFAGCKKLKEADVSGFNTAAVTDMGAMFEDCAALESIDVSKFNTAKVENMDLMFAGCKSLKKLDLSKFDMSETEETEVTELFVKGCSSLEALYLPASVLGCEFDDAKAGLTALKTVYYTGTLEEWRETRCSIAETVKLILNYGTRDEAEAAAPGETDTAMTPVPVITTETKELYLVKDQKFTLKNNDFASSDTSIISISKTGVLKVKKVTTGEPVLLTKKDGSQIIKVYVSKPVMQKSMKLKAGVETKKPTFECDSHLYVTWEIDNPDIATVDTNGNVTAIAKGTTYVIAHVNGKTYKCKVVVSEAATPEERELHLTVKKNKKVTIKGMKKPGWVSDNTDVVKINGTKFIAGKDPGKATVTSSDGKYKVTVYVEDPTIVSEGFTLKKGKYNITMKGGDIKQIKFKKLYRNVSFKSSKAENAFVDEDGYIRARKNGKAKLTAKINGKPVTINVTVQGDAPEPPVSVNAIPRTTL
ncbi:MAG: BspA family leucine-rich repeat surface protein [Lachnospiraceae bacterium]|nr:BspA family leucine-rich repeat surface protein [Lachnospiraceae bacterium]